MEDMVLTTTEDYELFKAECLRWIEIYGLKHWKVYYRHENIDDCLGRCSTNLANKIASITFAKKWPKEDYTPDEILHTAFHEVSELFLGPVCALANHRYVSGEDIDGEIHAVIRTLESVLYPKYLERKS